MHQYDIIIMISLLLTVANFSKISFAFLYVSFSIISSSYTVTTYTTVTVKAVNGCTVWHSPPISANRNGRGISLGGLSGDEGDVLEGEYVQRGEMSAPVKTISWGDHGIQCTETYCDDQVVTYLIFFRSEIHFSVNPLFVVFPLWCIMML